MTGLQCIIPILLLVASFAFLRARRSQLRREKMLGKLSDSPATPKGNRASPDLWRRLRLPNYGSLPPTGKACVIVAAGLAILILTRNPILALLPWPGFTLGRRGLQRYRAKKAVGRKEEQMLEFIDSLTQSLRSGLSLQQSLEHAVDDLGNEMGADIAAILSQVRMGAGLEETLSRAGESAATPSLRLTLTVLGLLHGKGGDLPRILERLRKRVAEGIEVRREARILTSQSRASGYLVSALPGVFLLVQAALNPRSLQPLLATPAGNVIILVALLLNATALVFIRKIVGQGG